MQHLTFGLHQFYDHIWLVNGHTSGVRCIKPCDASAFTWDFELRQMVFRIHRLNPSPLNGNGDSSYLKASNCQKKQNIYKDFTNLSLDEIYGPQKKRSLILSHVQKIFHFQNPSHCPKISEPGQWTSAEKAWLPEGAKRDDLLRVDLRNG